MNHHRHQTIPPITTTAAFFFHLSLVYTLRWYVFGYVFAGQLSLLWRGRRRRECYAARGYMCSKLMVCRLLMLDPAERKRRALRMNCDDSVWSRMICECVCVWLVWGERCFFGPMHAYDDTTSPLTGIEIHTHNIYLNALTLHLLRERFMTIFTALRTFKQSMDVVHSTGAGNEILSGVWCLRVGVWVKYVYGWWIDACVWFRIWDAVASSQQMRVIEKHM